MPTSLTLSVIFKSAYPCIHGFWNYFFYFKKISTLVRYNAHTTQLNFLKNTFWCLAVEYRCDTTTTFKEFSYTSAGIFLPCTKPQVTNDVSSVTAMAVSPKLHVNWIILFVLLYLEKVIWDLSMLMHLSIAHFFFIAEKSS